MFSSNTSQVAGGGPTDPQFNYVTLLLPGNGTNGAQNNTFVDSSTNNFSITRNGNTTQGTFTPYGANWSNFFDGSGDSLTTASNAAFAFGSGDFTIECWMNAQAKVQSFPCLYGNTVGFGSNYVALQFDHDSATRKFRFWVYNANSGSPILETSGTYSYGAWYHVAVTRSGSTFRMFIDGTQVATATYSGSIDGGSSQVAKIGGNASSSDDFNGYISNARLVKGTAVYTSNFTPSTTPLTAVSGTSLLTCQANRFRDNSSNNFAITRNGDVSVQRFSPFAPTAPYSAATVGGSAYFDGNGDYLTLPSNAALTLSGDFTIEFFVYSTGTTGTFWANPDGQSDRTIEILNGTSWIYFDGNNDRGFGSVKPFQWTHIALSRTGSTIEGYFDGVRSFSINDTATLQFSAADIYRRGRNPIGSFFLGYGASTRIIKGTGIYTGATITVPTAPLTAITNTSLLLNFTNGGIIDNAMMNDLETVGSAQISTAQAKFGTGSLSVNGSSGYLRAPQSEQFRFGTSDFTIEGWFYLTSSNSSQCIVDFRPSSGSSTGFFIGVVTGGYFQIWAGTNVVYVDAGIGLNQWYYFAVSRSGSTLKAFLNGSEIASVANSTNWTDRNLSIGFSASGAEGLTGYIDDLRITKAARYTANFTPPAAPFPTN